MDSEDSRDGTGDARSSSSSSSSSSRSRRSSSSSDTSKKDAKSPPQSPRTEGPRSPSQGPRSPSPTARSSSPGPRSPSQGPRSPSPGPRSPSPESQSESVPRKKQPQSPDNLSEAHSDINSPENSPPASPAEPKSPEGPKSPSDAGSNIGSPDPVDQYPGSPSADNGPKTPQSPRGGPKSPGSPDRRSADSASQTASPHQQSRRSPSSSPSPERSPQRQSPPSSPPPRSPEKPVQWRPEEKWRRHTKAEQKMVSVPRERSRSESSASSRSSSYNKRGKDPATEEISEGEMESDQDEEKSKSRRSLKASDKNDGKNLNISHEDLSDVSDLDSMSQDGDKEIKAKSPEASPDKQEIKVNGASLQMSPKSDSGKAETSRYEKVPIEKTSNTEDGEEQLDFEAEEGECVDPKPAEQNGDNNEKPVLAEEIKPGKRSRGSSLEEGEVSDEAERRPEESEPRPVCRFFSRGACTWGVSCRFLHPGVTDKGNYNMFEVVRGVPSTGSYPAPGARDVAPPESAWERGLRTAKEDVDYVGTCGLSMLAWPESHYTYWHQYPRRNGSYSIAIVNLITKTKVIEIRQMLRIANKRKEQDMDFEEKKLHLSVGGVVHDPDAELAYAAAAVGASPPRADAPHHRELDPYGRPERVPPYGPMYRGRGFARPSGEDRERFYEGRERGYDRERAYERPPYYEDRPPTDDLAYHKRRVRSSREVIVQRAEVERRESRREPRGGEEWADPWMRTEPARRRKPPSSDDSYSSSSSSNSSSRSSRSPSSRRKRRASSSSRQRLSPSVIVRERRLASARATAMNPPAPRRRAPSPAAARQLLAANPPPPAPHHRHKAMNPPAPRRRAPSPAAARQLIANPLPPASHHRHKEEVDQYGRTKPRDNRKKYSRSSSSGSESSSSSSESESDSHSSSTSGSSGARRARHARLLNAAARPRLNAKSNAAGLAAAVTIANKKESSSEKEMGGGKKRSATSPVDTGPSKKAVSRREELLKQLKAVEDAIARKRSKI